LFGKDYNCLKGLRKRRPKLKMHKLGKKRNLVGNWEGPYAFVGYKDGKGYQERDEGSRICIIKDLDGKHWEWARRDLQIYHLVF
jgi:hypothetical protein